MPANPTEYRIREVTRYIVTKCEWNQEGLGAVSEIGEYGGFDLANAVATAFVKLDPNGRLFVGLPEPAGTAQKDCGCWPGAVGTCPKPVGICPRKTM